MKNWASIGKASAPDIPSGDLGRIADTLNALEDAFRPLAQNLAPELEPAATFHAGEEQA